MDPLRSQRVAQAMREELSELIRFESSDPRLLGVEVSEVILSPDAKRAEVLVALPAGVAERAEAIAALEHAKNYLRRQLMQRMDLFRMPDLRFSPNAVIASGAPLERLLRRARRGRKDSEEPGS